jgi:succinoglycan biosynthesis transport protein ExoP
MLASAPATTARFDHVPAPGSTSDPFDIRRWIAVFRRRWKIFAITMALGVAGTLLFTLLQKPMYTGTASVALNVQREQLTTVPEAPKAADVPLDRDASLVDTQVEILRSARLALWVSTGSG